MIFLTPDSILTPGGEAHIPKWLRNKVICKLYCHDHDHPDIGPKEEDLYGIELIFSVVYEMVSRASQSIYQSQHAVSRHRPDKKGVRYFYL